MSKKTAELMDGQTNGQTHRQTDRQTDRQTMVIWTHPSKDRGPRNSV